MRLLFLVPNNEHKATAGSRIRYDRLAAFFDVSVQSLEELTSDTLAACDVCIFSKTYSLEAIAIAGELRKMHKLVGVDLFDDYFTQRRDARLLRFRKWLSLFVEKAQFAICSTPAMRRVIEHAAPKLAVHILPDPYPEIDSEILGQLISDKLAKAHRERSIDILWFGIGSNPLFPVGLEDLTAYASSLGELGFSGFTPRLTILTNKSALSSKQLAKIARLPIRHRLETWSLEAESKALAEAFVCFLPVNGQSFSRAKSLNRALTAISAGAQVLSPGFPLYADLKPAIYSDASELGADLQQGACRIRKDNVEQICRIVSGASAIENLVGELFVFLSRQLRANREAKLALSSQEPASPRKVAIIYGVNQDKRVIKALEAAGIYSVRSPFSRIERAYDIYVDYQGDRRIGIWISPHMQRHLASHLVDKCAKAERKGKILMTRVDTGDETLLEKTPPALPFDTRAILQETSAYRQFLKEVEQICARIFPDLRFLLSDINAYVEMSDFR